jgi:hypothetical protein
MSDIGSVQFERENILQIDRSMNQKKKHGAE